MAHNSLSVTKAGKMYQYDVKNQKSNKNNLFVKNCITTALFRLLEKKDLDEISIVELIIIAGVSRMGFYRNYKNKEEIIEEYILDCFTSTVQGIKKTRPLNFSIRSILLTTLENFELHQKEMTILLSRNLESLLFTCFEKAFYTLYQPKNKARVRIYSTQMFLGKLFQLEMTWIKLGMKETPAQIVKMYERMLSLEYNAL